MTAIQAMTIRLAVVLVRGKSGLRRAGCWVMPSGRNPKESATEKKPPATLAASKGETVR